MEALSEHIEWRNAQGAGPDDLLFLDEDSNPVVHTIFYGRHFRPTVTRLVKAGMFPHVNFHGLRDSAASILINDGASMYDIKERLGHSTMALTANTYGHFFESRDRKLANALDRARANARQARSNVVPLRKADHDG